MDKSFHPTFYQARAYLSILGLKVNHVSKRGPGNYAHDSLWLLIYDHETFRTTDNEADHSGSHTGTITPVPHSDYPQISTIRGAVVGNKIVDHSDVVGASPAGTAPTTSSFPASHLALMDWAKTTARRYEKHLSFRIWCNLNYRFGGNMALWCLCLRYFYINSILCILKLS